MAVDTSGLRKLSDEELVEAATYAYWLVLADDVAARMLLEALSGELARRGRLDLSIVRELAVAAVWSAVARVDRAEPFASQQRMRQLLRLIVAHTVEKGEPIRQEELGQAHYGKTTFSHQALSTEVRRLREVLLQYYLVHGVTDPLRINIPKGRYIAVIRWMEAPRRPAFLGQENDDRTEPGDPRPLNALPGLSLFPAVSINGNIVFSWNRGRGFRFRLYYQARGSATPTEFTSTQMTGDVCPAWSADGRSVAFLRYSPFGGEVIVADVSPQGAPVGEHRVARISRFRSEMIGRHLAWLPDGRGLLVSTVPSGQHTFAICRIDLECGFVEALTAPPMGSLGDGDPAVSPDGRTLAFVRTEAVGIKDVLLMDLASRRTIPLTRDGKHVYGIAWRRDGRSLAVASARRGGPTLWDVPLSGESPEQMEIISDRPYYPTFAPSGDFLAFTNLVSQSSIWEVHLNARLRLPLGRRPRRWAYSARNDVNPHVSPDGRRVAFASDRTGRFEIWVCDRNGGALVKVSALPRGASAGSPRWSPDGREIAFDARMASRTLIQVLELETGMVRVLVEGEGENITPSWSRDGRSVYFTSSRAGVRQACRVSAAGGAVTTLTRREALHPIESPDGLWLYFARTGKGLLRVPIVGGSEEVVIAWLKDVFRGLWDVSGAGVFYVDSAGDGEATSTLEHLDLTTGANRRVTTIHGMTSAHYQGLSVTPDGNSLFFSRLDQARGEIMIADLGV